MIQKELISWWNELSSEEKSKISYDFYGKVPNSMAMYQIKEMFQRVQWYDFLLEGKQIKELIDSARKIQLEQKLSNVNIGYGHSLILALCRLNFEIYSIVNDSSFDPKHLNSRIPMFYKYITK